MMVKPVKTVIWMTQPKIGSYRWRILALLFMATTINYMDRSILGVLGPTLRDHVFSWTNQQYANINIAFKIAYAVGLLTMGAFIDRLGTKKGYLYSIGTWSVFSLLHALVTKGMGWMGFAVARFGLGFGESGNFPACIKTVAEWFPKKERALATGIFNAGTNVGAILTPLVIPLIVSSQGEHWQRAFLVTAVFSATWVVLWLRTYRKPESHPKLSAAELDHILSDSAAETLDRLPWSKVLPVKETWAFAVAKIPDAVWYFYLFWGGFFLNAQFGLELRGLALPLVVIYVFADFGSIGGGWLSSFFIKKGWPINRARKTTLFLCAAFVMPVVLVTQTSNQWLAVALMAMAAAGHQAWSANAFTLASDVFPKKATASVVGIGGMVGALSGLLADFGLGKVLDHSGRKGYFFAFLIAGLIYMFALLVVHLIMPRMTPLDENLKPVRES
jgi:ACS family hexuronate transporter-like MFS transporter